MSDSRIWDRYQFLYSQIRNPLIRNSSAAETKDSDMATQDASEALSPLLIPCSYLTTESNKTGSWRFLRPRYEEKTAPCSAACPAGEDIGRIEMLTARGLFKEAWETILQENPFPSVCGRVCYHPCEQACNRSEFDEPVDGMVYGAVAVRRGALAEPSIAVWMQYFIPTFDGLNTGTRPCHLWDRR